MVDNNYLVKLQNGKEVYKFDSVGSFLRSETIKKAVLQFSQQEISKIEWNSILVKELPKVVESQINVGLPLITTSEIERKYWHLDFFWNIHGIQKVTTSEGGFIFQNCVTDAETVRLAEKIRNDKSIDHPFLSSQKQLIKLVEKNKVKSKLTIPAPFRLYTILTNDINNFSTEHFYPNQQDLFDDIVLYYTNFIKEFYKIGGRYIQLDDTTFCMIAISIQDIRAGRGNSFGISHFSKLGEREKTLLELSEIGTKINNAVVDNFKDYKDLVFATHTCRGNHKSQFAGNGQGHYDIVAKQLFEQHFDAFYLEFDDPERDGGFEVLKQFPKDKHLIAGLFCTKHPQLEDENVIIDRIKEIKSYTIASLGLSGQCGFSSTSDGNSLTEEEQWKKQSYIKNFIKYL